jgi:hypothetical protein
MTLIRILITFSLLVLSSVTHAYTTDDARISQMLEIMQSGNNEQKEQMLERLQWSGLSDSRLFDTFESDLMQHYQETYLDRDLASLLAYEVRALGYSGNPKYVTTLELLANKAANSKLKRHARKAKSDLPQFIEVQQQLAKVKLAKVDEQPADIISYMKLLETNDSYAQRLAARAIYHEQRTQPVLLDLVAEKLKNVYMDTGLDKVGQDMAAWLCKDLKQSVRYKAFLKEVAANTPHKKIKRYAD